MICVKVQQNCSSMMRSHIQPLIASFLYWIHFELTIINTYIKLTSWNSVIIFELQWSLTKHLLHLFSVTLFNEYNKVHSKKNIKKDCVVIHRMHLSPDKLPHIHRENNTMIMIELEGFKVQSCPCKKNNCIAFCFLFPFYKTGDTLKVV